MRTCESIVVAALLSLAAGTAAADEPCWECKASACYHYFKEAADGAWRDSEAAAMASWDEISARVADHEAANAEHDAVVAGLEADRDRLIAEAYDTLRTCFEP